MKKNVLTLIFLFSFYHSNAQWIFQKAFGNNGNERCQSAFQTHDGGLLLNGVSTSFGTGDVDALIIKTNAQGTILWSKTCGTAGNEIPTYAAETYDNKFIFIGTRDTSLPGTYTDVLLFKTDSAGNYLWAKTFGGVNNEFAVKIIELPNHGYVLTGTTDSYGYGYGDIYFIKTDANGDTALTRIYGTPDNESGKSMAPTSDGGFIICGKSSSIISGALVFQAILLRIDSTGNIIWSKLYGDSLFQEAQSVVQTADGGFIVCGSRDFGGSGNYDILLFKTDSAGDIQWSKTYGGNKGEGSYTVNLNEDGTYVLSGYTNSMGFGHRGDDSTNVFLMKTYANGDTIWTRAYGDSMQDEAFLSAKTPDGGFILSGFSDYHNADSSQMLVIKTDDLGFSGCNWLTAHPVIVFSLLAQINSNYSQTSGMVMNSINLTTAASVVNDSTYCLFTKVDEPPQSNSFVIFPNPATGRLFVKGLSIGRASKHSQITVYNLIGEKIIVPAALNLRENYFELNVASLKQGFYLLEITTETEKTVQRFIKE